jgi:hypothetical protein
MTKPPPSQHQERPMKDDADRARARVTDAIRKADEDFGYSIRLTRLVDDVATYTLTFPGEEPLEFGSNEDANEHVRAERDKRRADAILLAFAQQPEGWVLVPREPTIKMSAAGNEAVNYHPDDIIRNQADIAWSAMLDVAPIPGEE